jgi:superfamily II DNA or RNA helicase
VVRLDYERGTIAIRGSGALGIPHAKWDGRTECYRVEGFRYPSLINFLSERGAAYEDNVLDLLPAPNIRVGGSFTLRDYQEAALGSWKSARWGIIVIPSAGGKTLVGIKAIETVNVPTLVVVPTLALIDNWIEKFRKYCAADVDVGEFTGDRKRLRGVTVSTYDSAYINADTLGNRFGFLIADECHHLAAESYIHIAEFFASPYRMGLTATLYRPDGLHERLTGVFGGKVYTIDREPLSLKGYLAECDIERVYTELTPEERAKYDRNMQVFRGYMVKHAEDISSYQDLVLRSGSDPDAWDALQAHERGEKIAFNSKSKIERLGELLSSLRGAPGKNRIIIFTKHNDLVRAVSTRHLIPGITHKTSSEERRDIFDKFKSGSYSAIVSSQILDEGVDVPDANVGIIVSGTGSSREYIQRMGRILRPKAGKAKLYEIVSSGTSELRASARRRRRY